MVGSHAYQAAAKREGRATIGLGGQAQHMKRCRDVDGAPMSRSAAYRADRFSLVIVRMPLKLLHACLHHIHQRRCSHLPR